MSRNRLGAIPMARINDGQQCSNRLVVSNCEILFYHMDVLLLAVKAYIISYDIAGEYIGKQLCFYTEH